MIFGIEIIILYKIICTVILLSTIITLPILNSEMDTLKYRPKQAWYQSNWYLGNNWTSELYVKCLELDKATNLILVSYRKFVESKVGWWILKNPFSFLLDGWHFIKTLYVFQQSIILSIAFISVNSLSYYSLIYLPVIIYTILGAIFNLTFYK